MNSVAEIYGGYTNSTARAMIMIPIYLSIYGRPNPITRWRKALGIGNPFPPLDHLRPFGIPMDDRSRRAEHTAGCAPVGSVLAELMIRRTFLSRIPFDSDIAIGAHIPPLQREVVDVTFNYVEADEYKKFSLPHKRGLFIKSQIDPNKYVWNMKKLRKLVLLTSWLGFHYLESALHAENIATVCVLVANPPETCAGPLREWPSFLQNLIVTDQGQKWSKRVIKYTQQARDLEAAAVLVGDEHGVQARFQQSIGQVLGKVLDTQGIDARFADASGEPTSLKLSWANYNSKPGCQILGPAARRKYRYEYDSPYEVLRVKAMASPLHNTLEEYKVSLGTRLEARHVWFLTATTLYNRTSDLRGSLAVLYSGLRRSELVNDMVTDMPTRSMTPIMPGFTTQEWTATGHLEKLKNSLAAGVRRLEPETRMKTDITRKDCEALLKHLASQFNSGKMVDSEHTGPPTPPGTIQSNPVPDNVLTIRPGLLTLPGNTNVTNNLPEIENPETLDISDADHNAIPPINNQEPPVPRWYPRPTSDGGIYVLSTIQQLMEPPRRQVPVLGVMVSDGKDIAEPTAKVLKHMTFWFDPEWRYPEAAQKTLQSFTWTTEVKSVILEESTLAPNGMRGYPPDTDTSEVARLPQPPIANRFPPKREDLGWKDKKKSVMAARARTLGIARLMAEANQLLGDVAFSDYILDVAARQTQPIWNPPSGVPNLAFTKDR
ncbi:hypothetical protein CFD26_107176 [Aspergillus turcosus]|uniref:Uncharacterized protein n=1 Tax=Aspergillus turcosus TaxID=1245748 RepID=A0A421D5T3_9EURO|nr:hypothetical protein CFD26_107176 [Aspergillus turcosus]